MTRTGRFAPSPTGNLHLGNLRTALLAWWFARSQAAGFRIRFEDLDTSRVRPGVAEQQLADLAAIGIDWDGDVVFQSRRTALYEAALTQLEERELVYPCFCTRAEIHAAVSAPHAPAEQGAYPGTCRHLTSVECAARLAAGRRPALRVRCSGPPVVFVDRLHGRVEAAVDDFVVRRGDGAFAYNLAVVVDDAAQEIGEVVRGDDLLSSTGRQLRLAELLGLPAPVHAHVPLVLGPDGSRLAKRHGAVTLRDLSAREAFAWICASLGLSDDRGPRGLIATFDPDALPLRATTHP